MREPGVCRLRFAPEVLNQLDPRGDSRLAGAVRPRVWFPGIVGGQALGQPVGGECLVGDEGPLGAHGLREQPHPEILVWQGCVGDTDSREEPDDVPARPERAGGVARRTRTASTICTSLAKAFSPST